MYSIFDLIFIFLSLLFLLWMRANIRLSLIERWACNSALLRHVCFDSEKIHDLHICWHFFRWVILWKSNKISCFFGIFFFLFIAADIDIIIIFYKAENWIYFDKKEYEKNQRKISDLFLWSALHRHTIYATTKKFNPIFNIDGISCLTFIYRI